MCVVCGLQKCNPQTGGGAWLMFGCALGSCGENAQG